MEPNFASQPGVVGHGNGRAFPRHRVPPERAGHVAIAHALGLRPMSISTALTVTLYEEYHPYGTSAYRAMKSGVEVSAKRYRYTGKERDEETSLYYHGSRYYAPWLGRWTAADPLGLGGDGPGLYNYCRGSPVVLHDPNGTTGLHSAVGERARQINQVAQAAAARASDAQQQPVEVSLRPQALELKPPTLKDVGRVARHTEAAAQARGESEVGSPEHVEQVKAEVFKNEIVKGAAVVQQQRQAEASRLSPGEAHAEIRNFGDRGGAPLKVTIEAIALDKGLGLAARGVRALGGAVNRALTVDLGIEAGSLGLEGLGASASTSERALSVPRLYIDAASATNRELEIASAVSKQGRGTVVIRDPVQEVGRRTTDLVIEGAPYDIYSPTTSNPSRIVSALAKKNQQATGVVLDLSRTTVTEAELGNVLGRVRGAGATRIQDIIIMK